jgi:two-component system response regulator YesN
MKLRILIADDEQLERRALCSILSTLPGHTLELLEAANGRQAVALVESGAVDLAFLDIRMPGLDGLQVAHQLRTLCPDIHIVFVTAFDHFDYAREAIRLGVDEYLVKPASSGEVLGTTVRVLERIEARRQSSAAGLQSDRDGEHALALLEEELTADLGKSGMDSMRLSSFFSLKGFGEYRLLVFVMRLNVGTLSDEAGRQLVRRRVEEICGRELAKAGWKFLMKLQDDELSCAAAVSSVDVGAGADTDTLSGYRKLLESLVEGLQRILGIHSFIGACCILQSGHSLPFAAARDALALARPGNPFVVLASGSADSSGIGINRHGSSTVERALDYMHAHLADDLSLADVAAAVGSAPSHLSRLFSRDGGDTFVHVFCRLRIAAAKDLLHSGQYRVKEVCSMVGFNDQAYFSRVFRKYEGVSPIDYNAG